MDLPAAMRAPMVKRRSSKRPLKLRSHDGGKAADGLSTIEPAGILVRDHAAARRWMVSVIATRAMELHRERRKRREEEQAQEPGGNDDGNAHGTTEREQEGQRG